VSPGYKIYNVHRRLRFKLSLCTKQNRKWTKNKLWKENEWAYDVKQEFQSPRRRSSKYRQSEVRRIYMRQVSIFSLEWKSEGRWTWRWYV